MEVHARPHGAALVKPLTRSLLLAALGGAGVVLGGEVHWVVQVASAALIALAACLAVTTVWDWERTSVDLRDDVLLVRWGILRRRLAEVRIERSRPVELEQGITGRLLGYATLVAGDVEVPYVPTESLRRSP